MRFANVHSSYRNEFRLRTDKPTTGPCEFLFYPTMDHHKGFGYTNHAGSGSAGNPDYGRTSLFGIWECASPIRMLETSWSGAVRFRRAVQREKTMPIIVNCPACGKNLGVPDGAHGKKPTCPHCGVLVDQPSQQTRRLGVALSGGGFRAAFFHIGVLAQMAHLGMLRHVQVLSTVSGGSIIGAFYYLHVKRLLETKEDAAVTDQDYRDLVLQIEKTFFEAVQQNLRVRSLLDPRKLIQTCLPDFSRTDHLGYLLDQYFFRPVVDATRKTPIEMRELRIQPKGGPENFRPDRDNGSRSAKVPVLLLNAASLNTGHNWRFEAGRMGEPALQTPLVMELDKLFRLRRPASYEELPPHHRGMELGLAVAASCCVPGIFPPLALSGLYDRGIRVQLVDGGVRDNQGIDGLFDQECTDFVISDASEQIREEIDPPVQLVPVVFRSTDILGNQLRAEALMRLMGTGNHRVALLHLRKGLSAEAISWLDGEGRPAEIVEEERMAKETFGVLEETQVALSRMRTDFDSFTEVEAYSLTLDAYLMSAAELRTLSDLAAETTADDNCNWRFLQIEPWLRQPTPRFRRRLHVAQYRHLKLLRLKWPITLIMVLALLAVVGWLVYRMLSWGDLLGWFAIPIPLGVLFAAFVASGMIILPQLINVDRFPWWLRTPLQVSGRFLVFAGLAPFVSAVSAIQLYVLHPLYQREGQLNKLGSPPADTSVQKQ